MLLNIVSYTLFGNIQVGFAFIGNWFGNFVGSRNVSTLLVILLVRLIKHFLSLSPVSQRWQTKFLVSYVSVVTETMFYFTVSVYNIEILEASEQKGSVTKSTLNIRSTYFWTSIRYISLSPKLDKQPATPLIRLAWITVEQ